MRLSLPLFLPAAILAPSFRRCLGFAACTMAADMRPLKTFNNPPALGKPHASVVFLHGSGDTGDGVQGWAGAVSDPPFAFDNVNVVFPSAHQRPYSLLGPHGLSSVWFDRSGLGPQAPEDTEGIDKMSKLVRQVIDQELDKGVPLQKIILGGFSMGGAMAVHAALGDKELAAELAGVFVLSSFLADNSALYQRVRALKASGSRVPPMLQCHGLSDPMIRPTWGETMSKKLQEAGVGELEWHTFPNLQHELGTEEMRVLRKWVVGRLGTD